MGKAHHQETMTTLSAENQYVCHELLVNSKWAEKITYFAQSKRDSPEHNLHVPTREKNSLEQAEFWHDVKVVLCTDPLFTREIYDIPMYPWK